MEKITMEQIAEKKGMVLVDFFATWCMPCKMQAGILETLEDHYKENLEIIKINIDENTELVQQMDVMSVPTMIIYKDGVECEKMVGVRQFGQLVKMIDEYRDSK